MYRRTLRLLICLRQGEIISRVALFKREVKFAGQQTTLGDYEKLGFKMMQREISYTGDIGIISKADFLISY